MDIVEVILYLQQEPLLEEAVAVDLALWENQVVLAVAEDIT
jgi:hypothetical protein